ncbi:MAG: glycoside-pentoside-hexuronide (GPH):cation symporter [Oscillospiraceae bacterium]|jgi:GPH family glycoside/pentoside/hexuronide:cation symporter|nr:glycoside-pentoside-hexuronide (GPH):cation symporter [Oscillospiraceae bacterium]
MSDTAATLCAPLPLREKLAYGLGDAACQLTFATVGSFLQMFYTDILGLLPGSIALLMVIARVWDAINDPLWGRYIDRKPAGPRGRFRKWLLYVPVPLAVSAVLAFTRVPGLSQGQYLLWAYVTYIAYGMLYTGVNIPYGSLAGVISPRADDRASLSVFRSVSSGLGGIPAAVLMPMLVFTKRADGSKVLDASKFFPALCLVALLSIVLFILSYRGVRERTPVLASGQSTAQTNFFQTIGALLRNRAFVVLCLASMCLIAGQLYLQTINGYLFKDYFVRPDLISLYSVAQYLPMGLLLPILGKLVRRFGKKELCAMGAALSAVAYLATFFLHTNSPYVYLLLSFVGGLGMAFFVTEVWALVTDVIDAHELRTGQREEGTAYAFYSFARKLGQTAAGAGGAALLGVVGYVVREGEEIVTQTARVTSGMYTLATLVPAVLFALVCVLLAAAYPLDKESLQEMQAELATTRSEG